MVSFARINGGGIVVELFATLPVFTPELMATIRPCDGTVAAGYLFDGQNFLAPPPPTPPPTFTPKELAQALMADPSAPGAFARGLTALLAQRFGLTQQQVITAIANAAS